MPIIKPISDLRNKTNQISDLVHKSHEPVFITKNGEGDMVAVRVETTPTFSAGPASVLFPATDYLTHIGRPQYDVTRDGQRFIMLRPVGGDVQTKLILVQNFFEELRTRVPPP